MYKYKLLLLITQIFFGSLIASYSQTWQPLGDSTQILNSSAVRVIKNIDGLLYVGGSFRHIGIAVVNRIAVWDGETWNSMAEGLIDITRVEDIIKHDNEIYAGGFSGWRKFDGDNWVSIGEGLDASWVRALGYNNKIYLGGSDIKLNGVTMNSIAGWDGVSYSGLAGGVTASQPFVDAMCVYNNELIVGGNFNYAGGKLALNIAAWNGLQWRDLKGGTSGPVNSFLHDTINNFLYVGGGFNFASLPDYVRSDAVAIWDGYNWTGFGTCFLERDCFSMAMYNNRLFTAHWSLTGEVTDTVITRYDGVNCEPVYGPNETIFALEVYNGDLYVGGGFTKVGEENMYFIARYNEPPDTVSCNFIKPVIYAMPYGTKQQSDTIYMDPLYHIQFYNNNKYASNWHWDFGDGNTSTIREPAHIYEEPGTYNISLEVVHPHNLSLQVCTLNVSRTITIKEMPDDTTSVHIPSEKEIEYLGQNIPNPFKDSTNIPYYVPEGSKALLQIHNIMGELIDEYMLKPGSHRLEVSLHYLKSGTYIYSIIINGTRKQSRKMMVE